MRGDRQNFLRTSPARNIALVGIMAATVECSKLVLSFLPNIETVTLLLALYGYVFGVLGFASAIVFVSIEPLIYGFNTWVVSYFLYWPLIPLVFWLLSKLKVKNRWLLALAAVILTVWFGVLSALVDIGLLSGFFDNFAYRFAVYYARGVVLYAVQIACNAILFPLLFPLLSRKFEKIKRHMADSQ